MTSELRERVLELRAQGLSYSEIRKRLRCSSRTVYAALHPSSEARLEEASRIASQRWKSQNREANRARDLKLYHSKRRDMPFNHFLADQVTRSQ